MEDNTEYGSIKHYASSDTECELIGSFKYLERLNIFKNI